jgi:hypothetical protein
MTMFPGLDKLLGALPLSDGIKGIISLVINLVESLSKNSSEYNNGEISLDQYLGNVNNTLTDFKSTAAKAGVNTSGIPSEVKTVEDVAALANELQNTVHEDRNMSVTTKLEYEGMIKTLKDAGDKMSQEGGSKNTSLL